MIVFRIFQKPPSTKKEWVVYRLPLCIYYSASATWKDFFSYQVKKSRAATATRCYPMQFPFSPGPAVSNHLLPPAGPCPVVTRLVPVSKQTGEIPGPEAEAVSMGTIEKSVYFLPVKNSWIPCSWCTSWSLVISGPDTGIALAVELPSLASSHGCSEIPKCLTREFIAGNREPLRGFQNIVAKNYTLGVIWSLTVV